MLKDIRTYIIAAKSKFVLREKLYLEFWKMEKRGNESNL